MLGPSFEPYIGPYFWVLLSLYRALFWALFSLNCKGIFPELFSGNANAIGAKSQRIDKEPTDCLRKAAAGDPAGRQRRSRLTKEQKID